MEKRDRVGFHIWLCARACNMWWKKMWKLFAQSPLHGWHLIGFWPVKHNKKHCLTHVKVTVKLMSPVLKAYEYLKYCFLFAPDEVPQKISSPLLRRPIVKPSCCAPRETEVYAGWDTGSNRQKVKLDCQLSQGKSKIQVQEQSKGQTRSRASKNK